MMNAAISESARSSDFDRGFAPSSGGMRFTKKETCTEGLGSDAGFKKVRGSVCFGAMPMDTHAI